MADYITHETSMIVDVRVPAEVPTPPEPEPTPPPSPEIPWWLVALGVIAIAGVKQK